MLDKGTENTFLPEKFYVSKLARRKIRQDTNHLVNQKDARHLSYGIALYK